MISDIEDYFTKGCGRCDRFETPECSARLWSEGLSKLRQICLDAGLDEAVKWGHPCYVHAGRNIAIFGAYRADFRLSFFHAALMKDPEGVLERIGPNTPVPGTIRFKGSGQVDALKTTLRAYLAEAKRYAELGLKPPKPNQTIDWPQELVEALDIDPELSEAFHALTPGRQKSYVINLNGAKKSETRTARIVKFRNKIIAGKGATER